MVLFDVPTVKSVVVITTLTQSPDSSVPSFDHIILGAEREDEEGCSAEHLRKVPFDEINFQVELMFGLGHNFYLVLILYYCEHIGAIDCCKEERST